MPDVRSRPSGEVVVFCAMRVVGASWPPVIPYTALFTKMTAMGIPSCAA